MLDFTSVLYLGMHHPHHSLRPWATLTTGRPAALYPPPGAADLARLLAGLIGCEQATLGVSTLHLAFDLFGVLASSGPIVILVESGTYPVLRWGVELAAARGVPVVTFAHHAPKALANALASLGSSHVRPVVVADGLCPATGQPVPLNRYLDLVRTHRGTLVIDDTQALGILGGKPTSALPYGHGGGGTAAWYGRSNPELIVLASLAKGFGVPLAVLAGSLKLIENFKARSATRTHCSAPSAAHIAAAVRALDLNHKHGDRLRRRLFSRVRHLRRCLDSFGIPARGGLFPVQTPVFGVDAENLHGMLAAEGIATVLHRPHPGQPAALSLIVTAAHQPWEIDLAVTSMAALAAPQFAHRRANLEGLS